MEKIKTFVVSHLDFVTFVALGICFFFVFFFNIGNYPLMDVDETRYVTMSKDMLNNKEFLTLYLNGEYFFEKPPLFFWSECLSFGVFGKINEFTARFPVAFYGMSCCYLVYFMGKKIVSRLYGAISSLILATSLEFFILSKFAILDIVVSAYITISLCFGVAVYFCRESRRKYYWWLFYVFSGFAVMAKGLPGMIIPFGSMFFMAVVAGKFKDIFKPVYFLPGMALFFLITLPWHIVMFKLHNPLFWNEYIVKHHLARFLGSEVINREQPWYFYLLTLLWGFFPWILSCLSLWTKALKLRFAQKRLCFNFSEMSILKKFLTFQSIIAIFTALFFSVSGTKLITYILPIYISMACLGGYVWYTYITQNRYETSINKSSYLLGVIFILASIATILTPLYLSPQLVEDISITRTFCMLNSFAFGLTVILFTKKRMYLQSFLSIVFFMTMFSAIGTKQFFEIDYKFGQNDLIKFAKFVNTKDATISTVGFAHKYSLIYYGETKVSYDKYFEQNSLDRELSKPNNYVIVKLKDLNTLKKRNFDIIDTGRKYALLRRG